MTCSEFAEVLKAFESDKRQFYSLKPNCSSTSISNSKPVLSWIEPVLELKLEALEHLFCDAFDVSELAPTSHITVFRRALNLYDKPFNQPKLVRVFFPENAFCKGLQFVSAGS